MNQCQNRKGMEPDCYRRFESQREMVIAMAYVPWQQFGDLYEPDKALSVGTVFPELNKPFVGKGGMR